jgi:NAD(P)-dependent dehydrogenase (short-subunit alcohol dehydrogenase family)
MTAQPLAGRSALLLGVERALGRKAAVALAEAGADVAVVTLSEATEAEFAANSVANELWAIGRKAIALTSDGAETAIHEAIAHAAVELGPVRIAVHNAAAPLATSVFEGLRSDPAIVVLVADAQPEEARALLAWTRDLAATGLRANAIIASGALPESVEPILKQHHPPEPLDFASAIVYLVSDASAALEGAVVVASD